LPLAICGVVLLLGLGALAVIALPTTLTAVTARQVIPAMRGESPISELPSDDAPVTLPAGQLRALINDQQAHDERMGELIRDVAISGDVSQVTGNFLPLACLGVLFVIGIVIIWARVSASNQREIRMNTAEEDDENRLRS
jgi:hypothetical protein